MKTPKEENKTAEEILKKHYNVMIDDIEAITDAMQEYADQEARKAFEASRKQESKYIQPTHPKGIFGITYTEMDNKFKDYDDYKKQNHE